MFTPNIEQKDISNPFDLNIRDGAGVIEGLI